MTMTFAINLTEMHLLTSYFFLESRWDPPPTGFVSIEEQERLDSKEKNKQNKKAKVSSLESIEEFVAVLWIRKDRLTEYEPNPDPGVKTTY
jgi:hypothetical protein